MNKTYDWVEWDFLEAVLSEIGFNQIWVSRVMSMVASVSYTYQFNGFKTRVLIPQRGLKQGDPISPYLFILVFDVLSRKISRAFNRVDFNGIGLANSAPTLTHLFFVDDVVIFSQDSPESIVTLTAILNLFTAASSQRISTTKLGIIFGKRTPNHVKTTIANILQFPIWHSQGTYLGIPVEWGGSKVQNL